MSNKIKFFGNFKFCITDIRIMKHVLEAVSIQYGLYWLFNDD